VEKVPARTSPAETGDGVLAAFREIRKRSTP
jgi:hypothetical protein